MSNILASQILNNQTTCGLVCTYYLFNAPALSAQTDKFPLLLSVYPYGDDQKTTFYMSVSPLFPEGKADLILAFEPAEAVRNLKYLKKDGLVIVNSRPVKPVTESLLDTGYDGKNMIEYLTQSVKTLVVDADIICEPLGSTKAFNVVILGVATGADVLGFDKDTMIKEIENRVKAKFVELNKKAFALGFEIGHNYEA